MFVCWSDCLSSCRKRIGISRERTDRQDADKQTKDNRKRCNQYKMTDKRSNDRFKPSKDSLLISVHKSAKKCLFTSLACRHTDLYTYMVHKFPSEGLHKHSLGRIQLFFYITFSARVRDKNTVVMPSVAQHQLARKPFIYMSNLVHRAWFLVPNSPITPSGIRIFIVPRMRFLSPDYALLD